MVSNGVHLFFKTRTALDDGEYIMNSDQHIASKLYYAEAGDSIRIDGNDYIFAVGTYNFNRNNKYKEEYFYLRRSQWITYNKDLVVEAYSNRDYIFKKDCYYKICIKRFDGENVVENDLIELKNRLKIHPKIRMDKSESAIKDYFLEEVEKCYLRYKEMVSSNDQVFKAIVITDTHNVLNGTWGDTCSNIHFMADKIGLDGIIHLGDLTDGILSKKETMKYAMEVISGLKRNPNIPFYMTLGNHDANYFWSNPEVMSISEQSRLYLNKDIPYYYIDNQVVGLIFLSSYDNNNPIRYGYDDEQLAWLENKLDLEGDRKFIIFSHDAPIAKLDYWAKEIYNGEKIIKLLESHNKNKQNILAFIHGHTHADYIFKDLSFPIVSVGCNKCEDFTYYKPDNSITYERAFDQVTQDLWDILVYNKTKDKIDMIRFGAGKDRRVR